MSKKATALFAIVSLVFDLIACIGDSDVRVKSNDSYRKAA